MTKTALIRRRRALRRAVSLSAGAFMLVAAATSAGSAPTVPAPDAGTEAVVIGQSLPGWQPGELDIHHINTGRGEASLLILPDGTSMLVDASGKTNEKAPFTLPTRPDATRAPGEWVARYVRRVLPRDAQRIDYAMISHFHGDHMGTVVEGSPMARQGGYQLSGITEVAEHVPIGTIVDRGWPDYAYPAPIPGRNMRNYRKFLQWQSANRGLRVERFEPGRSDQIRMLHRPGDYPVVTIRNIAANGVVWTGQGNATRALIPPLSTLKPDRYPDENKLSIAFRLSYGAFDYFSGGDLSVKGEEAVAPGEDPMNVETAVGVATGAVDAMKANHHGSWDANSAPFLRALSPQVIVIDSRAEGHPAVNSFARFTSTAIWPGKRDIFITNVSPATFKTTYGIDKAASTQGHVVIRVAPGGASFRVFVLDDTDETMRVKAAFGPYRSQ
ncbi:hypothetical protein DMC47_26670 [Nostoc sp. 3335mG]|nr:hypothetical protein DMC47_26670 [Nostoc sp. 3335mG]